MENFQDRQENRAMWTIPHKVFLRQEPLQRESILLRVNTLVHPERHQVAISQLKVFPRQGLRLNRQQVIQVLPSRNIQVRLEDRLTKVIPLKDFLRLEHQLRAILQMVPLNLIELHLVQKHLNLEHHHPINIKHPQAPPPPLGRPRNV